MPILHAVVLGIVQGLSEFLPISSSGHLALVPELFRWTELTAHPRLDKTFDVALHLGTFIGAVWYFRVDLLRYLVAGLRSMRTRRVDSLDARIAWLLVIATIPGVIAGAVLEDTIDTHLGDPVLIGAMLVVFGLVLLAADRIPGTRTIEGLSLRDAVFMGFAQALALQPGVSRSGVTISMGRRLGLDRATATRVSFLMSVPIIAGAALYKATHVIRDGIPSSYVTAFIVGIATAGVSGFIAIAALLKLLQSKSFAPFVVYRVMFGLLVIGLFASGVR